VDYSWHRLQWTSLINEVKKVGTSEGQCKSTVSTAVERIRAGVGECGGRVCWGDRIPDIWEKEKSQKRRWFEGDDLNNVVLGEVLFIVFRVIRVYPGKLVNKRGTKEENAKADLPRQVTQKKNNRTHNE